MYSVTLQYWSIFAVFRWWQLTSWMTLTSWSSTQWVQPRCLPLRMLFRLLQPLQMFWILLQGRDFPWSSCSRAFCWLPAEKPDQRVQAPVCCLDLLLDCLTYQVYWVSFVFLLSGSHISPTLSIKTASKIHYWGIYSVIQSETHHVFRDTITSHTTI